MNAKLFSRKLTIDVRRERFPAADSGVVVMPELLAKYRNTSGFLLTIVCTFTYIARCKLLKLDCFCVRIMLIHD